MKAFIKGVCYYLPEKKISNEDLSQKFPEWTVDKIAQKVGINNRHVAGENQTAGDMAIEASKKLFKEYDISPSSIDFVILCTQSPDYFLPTTACIIQDSLGIPTTAGAFDFNLGCSGYIYGLAIAKGLVTAGVAKNILLLTSETYSKYIHPTDKGNKTIFGDAASASIISDKGSIEILDFELGTDGKGWDKLIVKTGASRHAKRQGNQDGIISSDYLFMNGSEIFNFTLDIVPRMIDIVLEKNKMEKGSINLYIFHQANKLMLDFLRKKVNIDKEKFLYYMSETGNTVSSTIPIVLAENIKSPQFRGNILLAGFGVGLSWGSVILKCHK